MLDEESISYDKLYYTVRKGYIPSQKSISSIALLSMYEMRAMIGVLTLQSSY